MQLKMHMVTIEDLVPKGHFLRKLESALDLSFVYEETAKLYSHRYGRLPYDPVVMVKYLLVGYLYGIPSERQIEQRIQTDMALRWYLGLDVFDRVPDHSTISQGLALPPLSVPRFSITEEPCALPQEKTETSYPRASLGMSCRLILLTTSSHGFNRACLGHRWCRFPTRFPKIAHRATRGRVWFSPFFLRASLL